MTAAALSGLEVGEALDRLRLLYPVEPLTRLADRLFGGEVPEATLAAVPTRNGGNGNGNGHKRRPAAALAGAVAFDPTCRGCGNLRQSCMCGG